MSASQIQSKAIADDAITQAKLANDAVGTNEIANNAVTSAKIATGAVTNDELNASAITGQTAETVPDAADLILIYDDSAAGLKKMTRANFLGATVDNWEKETIVLSGTDITNQYVDFGFVAAVDSVKVMVRGLSSILEGASYEYSLSYTGGAGGVTRLSFLNDLATGGAQALVATDVMQIQYVRAS